MGIHPFQGMTPQIAPTAFIAEGATLTGNVTVAAAAGIWFNAVLRGDVGSISVGRGSNVQDCAVVHCDSGGYDTVIGEDVTIGHGAIIHGCRIESGSLIGMGAVVMNGVKVGARCLVAAGALLPEGKEYPPGSLIMGAPGQVIRPLTEPELAGLQKSARIYQDLAANYRAGGTADQPR